MRASRTVKRVGLSAAALSLSLSWVTLVAPQSLAAPPPLGGLTQLEGTDGCMLDSGADGCADGTALDGAASVAVSPDGKNVNVYVAASSASNAAVAAFARDDRTGALTQLPGTAGCISGDPDGAGPNPPTPGCATGRALAGATSVAVSPDGDNVYVASTTSDAVAILKRGGDGSLTQDWGPTAEEKKKGCIVNGPSTDVPDCDNTGRALDGASSVVVSPDGANVYIASSTSDAVAILKRNDDGSLTQDWGPTAEEKKKGCIVNGPSTDVPDCDNTGRALDGATSVAISPDGQGVQNAYVTSSQDSSTTGWAVTVFKRDTDDGSLGQLAGTAGCVRETSPGPAGCAITHSQPPVGRPVSVAVSPNGSNVYVTLKTGKGAVDTFQRASADGTLSWGGEAGESCVWTGSVGECFQAKVLVNAAAVAVSADGQSTYVAAQARLSVDSGVSVLKRLAGDDSYPGKLVQRSGSPDACVTENGLDGDDELGTGYGDCLDGRALSRTASVAVSPDDRNVYVASRTSGGVAVFARSLNRPPVCAELPQVVHQDTPATIALNCTDPDGDALAYSVAGLPEHGTLGEIDQAAGTVAYSPDPDFPRPGVDEGSDAFTFTATDGTYQAFEATFATQRIAVLPGPAPLGPTGEVLRTPLLQIEGRSVKPSRRGVARVGVSCRTVADGDRCQGTLTLRTDTSRNRRSHKRVRALTLGRGRLSIPAGRTRLVRVRVNRAGLALLRRQGWLWAQASVNVAGHETAVASRSFLLKAP